MDTSNWKSLIEDCLKEIEQKYELPVGSVHIMNNNSKKNNNEITSYSICIYEPEYPDYKKNYNEIGRNMVIARIVPPSDTIEVIVNKNKYESSRMDWSSYIKPVKSDIDFVHFVFSNEMNSFVGFIEDITEHCIKTYESKAKQFACCHRFEDCSNERKCLHENQLYSRACLHRKNLESGNVFYGKSQ